MGKNRENRENKSTYSILLKYNWKDQFRLINGKNSTTKCQTADILIFQCFKIIFDINNYYVNHVYFWLNNLLINLYWQVYKISIMYIYRWFANTTFTLFNKTITRQRTQTSTYHIYSLARTTCSSIRLFVSFSSIHTRRVVKNRLLSEASLLR